jgi:hypothetical protein
MRAIARIAALHSTTGSGIRGSAGMNLLDA